MKLYIEYTVPEKKQDEDTIETQFEISYNSTLKKYTIGIVKELWIDFNKEQLIELKDLIEDKLKGE